MSKIFVLSFVKKSVSVAAFAFLLSAGSAFAGFELRNGGYVEECKTAEGSVTTLLDLEEHMLFDASKAADFREIAFAVIGRVEQVDAKTGSVLKALLNKELWRIRFVDRFPDGASETIDPQDDGYLSLADCTDLHQVASQKIYEYDFLRTDIQIIRPLWAQMNELQRAGLIIHELMYFVSYTGGQSRAAAVRQLVKAMFEPELKQSTVGQIADLLKDGGIR